jgi:hypothetical protein
MVRLLTLAVLPILALGGDMKLPTPTYSGRLPIGFTEFAVLDTSRAALLLSNSGHRVIAYAWQSGAFKRKYNLPRLDSALSRHDSLRACGFSLPGDVDGDGIDEFVIAIGRTISKYKLTNGTLALTAVASIRPDPGSGPFWVTDGCIGDIDNDGRNEILISATRLRPPACAGDSWSPVVLFVCRWDKDSLVQLWNDEGALKLEQPDFDYVYEFMLSVADPRNSGANRLILLEGTGDDVHPAVFRDVVWRDGRLTDDGLFQLRDGRLQREYWNKETHNAATGCVFGQVDGKTVLLANIESGGYVWQGELFVFSGDSATQHRVLWSDRDHAWQSPSTGILIDLDGKGVGALRLMDPRVGGPRFEFYRL